MIQFKSLWMLVRGLISSWNTIVFICILLFIILYIFACLGVEVITKSDAAENGSPEFQELVRQYFPGITVTILTLVQFLTVDSVGAIYHPMCQELPLLTVYFMSYLVIVSIALMNLITAVIVESSLEQAQKDKDVRKAHETSRVKQVIPRIKQAFYELDEDGSGEVGVDEFADGMMKVAVQDAPIELVQVQAELKRAKFKQDRAEGKLDSMMEMLRTLTENVATLTESIARIEAREAQ